MFQYVFFVWSKFFVNGESHVGSRMCDRGVDMFESLHTAGNWR